MDLDALKAHLAQSPTVRSQGRVIGVTGLAVKLILPSARIGDIVHLKRRGGILPAEIVGFNAGEAIAIPLGELTGLALDDEVMSTAEPLTIPTGPALLGRVLGGLGEPLDGRPLPAGLPRLPVERPAPPALKRRAIVRPVATGLRAIDALLTIGEGQRLGLFAGSGVGKSSLLGSIARGTSADAVVVALVGERGREASEFLEASLGEAGRERAIVVVATSDAPAIERVRAAQVATTLAESLRDEGANVLLLVDSISRFARAAREVGLAAGEPPTRRAYPPSVFAALPRLLERAGQSERGSITGIYTVLVEGDDLEEPVADEVRGILDGHLVLSRQLAGRGHYPAIDVPASVSRAMPKIVTERHRAAASTVRQLLAVYEAKRDLLNLGAYARGSDPLMDRAIEAHPVLESFLMQASDQHSPFDTTVDALHQLAHRFGPGQP